MDLFDKFQFNDYVKKTLNNIHFTSPTPIQDKVIPLVYKNKDIIEKPEMIFPGQKIKTDISR